MADERTRHPTVEDDGHAFRFDFTRIEPRDRALSGSASDFLRRFEIRTVQRTGIIVVTLHRGAFTGNSRHRDALTRTEIRAAKTATRHQHHSADPSRCRCTAGLRDAFDLQRGSFGASRPRFQRADARKLRIEEVEIRNVAGQKSGIRKSSERILRRCSRHRESAISELGYIGFDVVCRHNGLSAPEEHAQPHIVAFRAFGFFDCAVAHLDTQRDRADSHGIGRIRAGAPSRRYETLSKIGQRGRIKQGRHGSETSRQPPVKHESRWQSQYRRLTRNIKRIPITRRHSRGNGSGKTPARAKRPGSTRWGE